MNQKQTPYDIIGGEAGVRRLVQRFYELMDTLPEAYGLRKLHPENLANSEEKLFMYLSGYLGGPQLFVEKFGHPMLRARHMPFAISKDEAEQWMLCMRMAMDECIADDKLRDKMEQALNDLAHHMRNQDYGQP